MTPLDVKQSMRSICEAQQSTPDGATWLSIRQEFEVIAADLSGLESFLLEDFLSNCAKGVLKSARRQHNAQLNLPGIGDVDATVTTYDGEGGYRVKLIGFATEADLIADLAIHAENVTSAQDALQRAERRNRGLIPLMRSQGFAVAGDAIAHLGEAP